MKGTTNSQRGTGGGGEKLVIPLKTNQTSHEDLIGAKFSVVINGNATEYTWQGASMTIPVPPMLSYTVEFGEVEGYAKPESVTHTAVAGNDRFVTGTYNTELVTVNVSAEEGEVSGYEIQIISDGNVLYTQTTPSASYKFPYGTLYTIKASGVSGYTTPSEQSFTASQPARNVAVVYKEIQYGVYIQDVSGRLYTSEEWDNQETANGIAVYNEKIKIVVSLEERDDLNFASSNIKVEGVVSTYNLSEAYLDYNGKNNTDLTLNAYNNNAPAVKWCKDYTFPNGQKGYMGAAGEFVELFLNKTDIESAFLTLGKAGFSGAYWTTTQSGSSGSVWTYNMTSGSASGTPKNDSGYQYTRAFTTLNI